MYNFMCTWNLDNFGNQCQPNKFNLKIKIKNTYVKNKNVQFCFLSFGFISFHSINVYFPSG